MPAKLKDPWSDTSASTASGASATQQALAALRAAIVDGRIVQGEQLREVHIAAMLGIGRSAVREAIRQLVQEGLVEHEPHRGAFVRVMDADDGLDLYAAREAIEVGVARRVVTGPAAPDVTRLAAAFEELQAGVPGDDDARPSERLIRADVRFHQELVRLGGSERLARVYDTFSAEMVMLLRHHPPYPAGDYVGSHRLLLEAVARRDRATPDLVRDHLRESLKLIGAGLAEHDGRATEPAA